MGSHCVLLTLLAIVLNDGAISADVYDYVPATMDFPQEASQFIPAESLARARFAWYQFPYSVVQQTPPGPMTETSDPEETKKIEITKYVQGPTRVNTATAIILNPPPGTNVSLYPSYMASSPNATNSSVAISPNEGNKVVTVMTNGVPHVLPSHGKTVFYIPDPPRYAVKPPPHGPPPTFNHTSPVDFKLPNNTTVSPATGVTTPETIAEVVSAGRQERSAKASLTKRTAHRPTYRPPPTPRRSSSDVKISKEHSVVSTSSTSKVTEMKNPGIFNVAAGLTSSVVEKAMKEAGSITAKPGTSLTDRSGTTIARNVTRELSTLGRL
ncbi:hypothetical protein MTO96_019685 [Rhipicephalus appendiculatus]